MKTALRRLCFALPLTILPAACDRDRGAHSADDHLKPLTEEEVPAFLSTPGRLLVVDFHAPWCGPCRRLQPVLNEVAEEFSAVASVATVNVDEAPELARSFGVRSLPDVRFFRDGREVGRFTGLIGQERLRALFLLHSEGVEEQAGDPNARPYRIGPTVSVD